MKNKVREVFLRASIENEIINYLDELKTINGYRNIKNMLFSFNDSKYRGIIESLISDIIKLNMIAHMQDELDKIDNTDNNLKQKLKLDSFASSMKIYKAIKDISPKNNVTEFRK